jgi:predicted nucleic acid-binding protein
MKCYFDTSVLVAAAVIRHPHHSTAIAVLEQLDTQKNHGFTSAHALAEVYSVLTRTPFRPPIYPSEAWAIIETMILERLELVTLTAKEYQSVVRDCAASGWIGGMIHDAIHVRCGQKAACDRIYTFNVKDFRALAAEELASKISVP